MLDISDGAAADLAHLCERSEVGVVVYADRLPIADETRAVCAAYNRDPADVALSGGGDYELLFTVKPERVDDAIRAIQAVGGHATLIGSLVEPSVGRLLRLGDGAERLLPTHGWDHLRDV